MTLPVKVLKRIAGTCLYSGCEDMALDGSDYCAPHDAHERGRGAGKQRRRRQALANRGRCIVAGCGRKVPKRKRPDGAIMQRRCSSCTKAHRLAAREKSGVSRSRAGVPGVAVGDASEARTTREAEGDGYARTRYHGQSRRGQQKRWQLDIQDAEDAILALRAAIRGFELARDAEEAQTPRVQRDEIRFAACAQVRLAGRFGDEIAERNGYDDSERGEIAETVVRARR